MPSASAVLARCPSKCSSVDSISLRSISCRLSPTGNSSCAATASAPAPRSAKDAIRRPKWLHRHPARWLASRCSATRAHFPASGSPTASRAHQVRAWRARDAGGPPSKPGSTRPVPEYLHAAAQRRHFERDHRQTIEQIFAKTTGSDFLPQIAVGRGQHAHVDLPRLTRTDALKTLFLQDPQQLGLQCQVDLRDFVQAGSCRRRPIRSGRSAPHRPR